MVLNLIHLTDLMLPGMRECRWGRVITSTLSGVVAPIRKLGISNMERAALVDWSRPSLGKWHPTALRLKLSCRGVSRRTGVGDWTKRELRAGANRSAKSSAKAQLPSPLADVVVFIASCRASYITGSVIGVDGGPIPSI